jgi:hypothetical protein
VRARELEDRVYRARRVERALEQANNGLLDLITRVSGRRWTRWLLEIIDPDLHAYIIESRAGISTRERHAWKLRDDSKKREWQATMAEKAIVDFDNPFEDPVFMAKIAGPLNPPEGSRTEEPAP